MPKRRRSHSDQTVEELARCKVLCDVMYGALPPEAYESLTGRELGRFVLHLLELDGRCVPPLAQVLEELRAQRLGRAGAVLALSSRVVAVLTGKPRGGGVWSPELRGGSAILPGGCLLGAAASASGCGSHELPLCYSACLAILAESAETKDCSRINALSRVSDKPIKPILSKTIEFITANYRRPITLDEIAKNAFVSPCHISRLFRKEMGVSWVSYLWNLRIYEAKTLLRETDLPIGDVSERIGIADPHYFAKYFKEQTGQSPTSYRKGIME